MRTGDHIHLSSVASVPHILIEALCRRADAGESARTVIAVVNANVPFSYGDLVRPELTDYLVRDDSPLFPWVISQNPCMTAINSAIEVDFTGQICADSIGTRMFSGTGGQVDFVRGATMSEGGKSITVFASRTKKCMTKIVPTLKSGAGVVTPRSDAHWIVTEYGAVDLFGKSLQERAKLLISIAHPDDRNDLDRAAFERFGSHYHNFSV